MSKGQLYGGESLLMTLCFCGLDPTALGRLITRLDS